VKKTILIALCCASLMLITPFTVVAQENKISRNLTEKLETERFVSQIRTRINEKKEKYKSIPKLSNILEIILHLILYLLDIILFRIVQVAFTIIFFPVMIILSPFIVFVLIIIWFISMS